MKSRSLSSLLFAVLWLFSRLIMFKVWQAAARYIKSDVTYYFNQLDRHGDAGQLIEYPTPVVWFLKLLYSFSGGSVDVFVAWFVGAMFALDVLATVVLWFKAGRAAAVYWTAFIFSVGALVWFRIDLIPAVAVCLALVWLLSKPYASGAAIAVGAATKFWPALLILPLVGVSPSARKRGYGFLIVGGSLGLASLLVTGWNRSISPLTWQSDRGLQIESVLASVPMARQAFDYSVFYKIRISQYNAFEIKGPSVEFWTSLGDVLLPGVAVLALVLGWLIGFGGVGLRNHSIEAAKSSPVELRRQAMIVATVALICAVIVTNKTFSPQYVIWLAGPLSMLIAARNTTFEDRVHAMVLGTLGILVAALTQQIYPLNYVGLIQNPHNMAAVTLLLLTRNAIMILMTSWSIWRAMQLALAVGREDN